MPNDIQREGDRRLDIFRLTFIAIAIVLSWLGIWRLFFPYDYVALTAVMIGGLPIFKAAYTALRSKSVTMEVAMSVGIVASLLVGEFLAATVITFFTLAAEFIDEFTIRKARAAIRELIEFAPKNAAVRRNGEEVELPVDEIMRGDTVIVRPGEKIAVDGKVTRGSATINQAPITGESIPVEKNIGDLVFAGTINQAGLLEVDVARVGKDTTLGRIVRLVEEVERTKSPVQKFADRFASRFVPIVLLLAFLTFILTRNITSAIAVMVVACPCAIAMATPLAVVASVGRAARKGIIIKGGIYLEKLIQVDTIVLDKTGTLTLGEPRVIDVKRFGACSEEEIVTYAAVAEKHSQHPFARAIMRKADEYKPKVPDHKECEIIAGKGVVCDYNESRVIVGSRELLHEKGIAIPKEAEEYMSRREMEGKTSVMIAHDEELCGVICLGDILRRDVAQAVADLKKLGLDKMLMLTGDNPRTAATIASQVGITEVKAGLMPDEKVERIRELTKEGRKILMVGDGVNDAPALAQADVGVAMGVAGTDVAIEVADVVLMTDDFGNLTEAIKVSRKTFNIIRQNIFASILFNVVGIALASTGVISPSMAAVAHVLPDFILFTNSFRLIR